MRRKKVLAGMLFFCAVILLSTVIMPIGIANAEDIEYHVDYYGVMQPLRIATTEEPAYSGDHSYTADTLQTPDNPSSGTMLKALIWPPLGKSISSPIIQVRVVTYIDCIDGDYNSQSLEYRLYAYNMDTGELTRKIHDDTWPQRGNTPTYFPLSYGLKTYDDTIICDTNKSALGENETLILLSICPHFGVKSHHTKYAAHFDTNDYLAYMEVFTSDGKSTKYYIHDSFTTPTVDDDGLLAYYPFNGNANDETGNGFHGTVYGATLTEDRFGNADNAFLFDNPTTIGTNRIVVTDGYGFNGGDTLESLTISSWFLPYVQSDECSYLLRFASTDGIGHLHFYSDSRVSFALRTVDAGIIHQMVSADISLNDWHHVAATWDGSVMRLYVDGVFRDEAIFPWSLSTPSSPTNRGNTIGANYDPDPNNPAHVCSFNGKIDEVRVYNRALTESEIKALAEIPDRNTITNTIGMEFVLIPAGEFEMGSPYDEAGRDNDEGPVHHVTIKNAFYMGRYEVTQKQWRAIMGDNPSRFEGDDLPVEWVLWNDVQEFIKKLNDKEGTNKYRLPSEAEWEYACRAGTTTRYSFGDSESELGDYAWYNSYPDGKTHPVGQKNPNSWGLYDMYGNVWEWVQDEMHNSYDGAPADGGAWESGDGAKRVIRGGGWGSDAGCCRSAYRYRYDPRYSGSSLGFRVLQEV